MFLKILTHLFSVFEVLNVCLGTCSMHETKEEFLDFFDSMHTFINYVALPYEGKSENIAISHLIKIQHFVAKALQSPF